MYENDKKYHGGKFRLKFSKPIGLEQFGHRIHFPTLSLSLSFSLTFISWLCDPMQMMYTLQPFYLQRRTKSSFNFTTDRDSKTALLTQDKISQMPVTTVSQRTTAYQTHTNRTNKERIRLRFK